MKKRRKNIPATENKKDERDVDESDTICYAMVETCSVCPVSVNVGLTVPNNVSLSKHAIFRFLC